MRKQTKIAALVSAAALLAIGASMTSFAAVGWVETYAGSNEWQWLDAYGDPIYDEWKQGPTGEWFYLGEDGYMVKDQIFTDTEDHTFCVDVNGVRLTNSWLSLDNEDDLDVNNDGTEESVLWMYFQSNGRAIKAGSGDVFTAKEVEWSGGKNIFLFNEDGYMLSGWAKKEGAKKISGDLYGDLIYYLGDENEGWARTGWNKLPVPQDHVCPDNETTHWYYFNPNNAQALVMEDGEKYIDSKWYSFEADGVLRESWSAYSSYDAGSLATPPEADTLIYNDTYGSQGYGWVYASEDDASDCFDDDHVSADGGSHWYYLVTYRDGAKKQVTRSIAFNAGMGEPAAKSINGKIYLFDGDEGRMLYGLQEISTPTPDAKTWKAGAGGVFSNSAVTQLQSGTYYFNEPENPQAANAGQMVTGRVTVYVEEDTQSYNYNFAKQTIELTDADGNTQQIYQGCAYKNAIVDGSYYDAKGRRVDAMDGNSYAVVSVNNALYVKGKTFKRITGDIVISNSGRVKTSGTVRIDDVKYTIKDLVIVDAE